MVDGKRQMEPGNIRRLFYSPHWNKIFEGCEVETFFFISLHLSLAASKFRTMETTLIEKSPRAETILSRCQNLSNKGLEKKGL